MIEVRHLTKKYGSFTAVDDLSFTVEEGQVYGFLGPNGAGKSTTMNMMTGYLSITEGEIFINGFDISTEPEKAKKTVGYLPEIPPLYPEMKVKEYLKFAAELKGVPKGEIRSQIEYVMKELGITEMKDRLIKNLSKGYKQRTGFAQALLGNPQTLILDEPTVGLDPKQIIEIRDLIKKLGKKHTVILSSHILSEVSEICDTVMIISHGKLVACDTPENLRIQEGKNLILDLKVSGDEEQVREALRGLVDDNALKITPDGAGLAVTVKMTEGNDIRTEISRRLIGNGCLIEEMKTQEASLESIFLELTAGSEDQAEKEDGR